MGRGQRSRGDYQGVVFTGHKTFITGAVESRMKKRSPVDFKNAARNIVCMVEMLKANMAMPAKKDQIPNLIA